MKFFICSLMLGLLLSLPTFASCTIDFENEISANVESHQLFSYVRTERRMLSRKGYHLVSANGPLPRWTAFIEIDNSNSPKQLVMDLHDFNSDKVITLTAPYSAHGVSLLLRKMPRCH